jgi:hypothetical protein
MKRSLSILMIAGLTLVVSSPAAMAGYFDDNTNKYYVDQKSGTTSSVTINSSQLEKSVSTTGEKVFSSPVVIQRPNSSPVVVEDRIVKKKHFFAVGIWPFFDFTIL